jgi:hypothetical protein
MDVGSVEAGAKRAERAIDGIGDSADRTNARLGKTSVSIDRVSESTDRYSHKARTASRDTNGLSSEIQTVNARFTGMRNAFSLIKWPALISGVGYAAEGLGTLSAGAVALTSALAPLSGALVAYPALLGSFAQGLGVAGLAVGGVKGVLSEMSAQQVAAGETAKRSGKAQESAAEGVRSAERQLTQAQVGARRAQTELTKAREEATENLKDLKNAAIDAGFGEQRAAMSLRDARTELKKALAEPGGHSAAELEGLELGVKEARQGLKEAKLEKQRADHEAARGSRQGVQGSPKYLEAKRQLGEANLQVAEAVRGLSTAEKAQKESFEETGGAAGKLASKLALLPAASQKFAKFIFGLKPKLTELQGAAAGGLFPGVEGGIRKALLLFPRLEDAVGATGKVMGGLARRAGELVGSKGFGRDFTKVADGNAEVIERMGNSGLKLADALRQALVAGQPLIQWMAKSTEQFATWIDNTAKSGRETGKLGGFFDKTRRTMETVGSIFKNVATGLLEIGKAAYPLGNSILRALNGQAEQFSAWTHSLEGKNALRDYFQQAKPGIFEVGRLIKDVGGAFLSLSNGEGFYTLTHEVRTQLVPVFKELLEGTTKALGPALIQGLVQLGKLFGSLGGASGPLVLFVENVTRLLSVINSLVQNVPGMKTLLVTIGGLVAVSKAMKFVGMVSGLSTALGIAKKLATTLGLIDAEQAAAGAGGVPIPGLGRTAAKSTVADAGEFGEKQALRDAGFFGGGAAGQTLGARALSALPGFLGTAGGLAATAGTAAVGAFLVNPGGGLINASKTASPKTEVDAIQKFEGFDFSKSQGQLDSLRKQFGATMRKLKSDAALGMGAINEALGTGLSITNETWIRGSGKWRDHAAAAMHAAVEEIRQGMAAGQIDADAGHKEINRLLGEIQLVKGTDPFGLARATVKTFKEVGVVSAGGISDWVHKLEVMPKAAREKARATTDNMLEAWAEGHPKIEAQIDNLTDYEVRKFGATNKQLREGVRQGATGPVAEAFKEAAQGVGGALNNIGTNTDDMLKALGLHNMVEFKAKVLWGNLEGENRKAQPGEKVATAHGGAGPHRARGGYGLSGYLPGAGLRDTVEVMAAPGEAFLTRHQQPEVQKGLAFAKQFGVVQNGSLEELFANQRTPHYMARGGAVDIQGPRATSSLAGGALEHVLKGIDKYLSLHGPTHGGGGAVPSGKGLMTIDGKPVAEWIAKILLDARKAGVAFTVSSGFRTDAEQTAIYNSGVRPAAVPKSLGGPGSRHEGIVYPLGAVDVSPGAEALAGWLSHSRFAKTLIYAGSKDPVHFSHPTGGGYARGGFKQTFGRGGYTSSDIKHSGVLSPKEWGIAMILGGFPAKPGVIAAGLGTIKSESSFNASNMVQGPGGHIGGWAESPAFGSAAARLNPILSSKAAFQNWQETGGFWQAWGQWEAEQSGLSGGGAGAYGPEFIGVAEEVIRGMGGANVHGSGGGVGGGGKTFPAGHTGSGGGTYGSPGPAKGKPPRMTETILPGLKRTPLEPAAAALPAAIKKMLTAPGVTVAQKMSAGELAAELASGTKQRTFDAEGNETSADSHADDIAAAEFQKKLVQEEKQRLEKRLRELAKDLKGNLTTKERNHKLTEQARLQGLLGGALTKLQGLNETIHTGPDSPEAQEEENKPTEMDFASRDLAVAELHHDAAGEKAAREKMLAIAEKNLVAAEQTADPRDDIEAISVLTQIKESIGNGLAELNQKLEEQMALQKQDSEEKQRALNVSQSQYGVLAQAIAAVVSGQIGGRVGLGFQSGSVAGALASY